MKIDMSQFLESFFEEAEEHAENMEAALLQLESAPEDSQLLNTVFRAAHSIKGASSTFGVAAVGEFTHILESLLDRMRDGELNVTAESTELLLASVDVLRGLLDAARNGSPEPDNIQDVVTRLYELNETETPSDAPVENGSQTASADTAKMTVYDIVLKPSRDFFHLGLDPLLLLRDLADCGTLSDVRLDQSELPSLAEMDPESCYLSWSLVLTTDQTLEQVQYVFMFVDDESTVEIKPRESTEIDVEEIRTALQTEEKTDVAVATAEVSTATPSRPAAPQRESVRVNGERLDDMINQIGELVIGISMVEQEWASLNPGTDSPAVVQLSKIVRDLQEQSLSLRMVPVAATFQKMARIVRDLGSKLEKKITFDVFGEETELDKTVVDQIGDPLIHMIRNSVDHGIESPEERLAAGKPAEGLVTVRAYHQGGNIYIELEDDGKGLDPDRILAKAIDRGIVSAEAKLSSQEIYDLVFHAGLSTADEVTDISGRGVGMDVVRRNIEELKGTISLTSEPGRGTKATVRLPLTLAILDGLLVSLGEEVYVVPLLSVVESFRPDNGEAKRLANGMEEVQVRGEIVPILHLHSVLNLTGTTTNPSEGLLVIVEDHDSKVALLVDDLLGQQLVVIKNLESNFAKVPGVAGATILGDGRVALILDVVGLKQLSAGPPQDEEQVA